MDKGDSSNNSEHWGDILGWREPDAESIACFMYMQRTSMHIAPHATFRALCN